MEDECQIVDEVEKPSLATPQVKKLKQSRLPFLPVSKTPQKTLSPTSQKKRRLSGALSSSPKNPRNENEQPSGTTTVRTPEKKATDLVVKDGKSSQKKRRGRPPLKEKVVKEKKKRGRPPSKEKPKVVKEKRKRGRPKKNTSGTKDGSQKKPDGSVLLSDDEVSSSIDDDGEQPRSKKKPLETTRRLLGALYREPTQEAEISTSTAAVEDEESDDGQETEATTSTASSKSENEENSDVGNGKCKEKKSEDELTEISTSSDMSKLADLENDSKAKYIKLEEVAYSSSEGEEMDAEEKVEIQGRKEESEIVDKSNVKYKELKTIDWTSEEEEEKEEEEKVKTKAFVNSKVKDENDKAEEKEADENDKKESTSKKTEEVLKETECKDQEKFEAKDKNEEPEIKSGKDEKIEKKPTKRRVQETERIVEEVKRSKLAEENDDKHEMKSTKTNDDKAQEGNKTEESLNSKEVANEVKIQDEGRGQEETEKDTMRPDKDCKRTNKDGGADSKTKKIKEQVTEDSSKDEMKGVNNCSKETVDVASEKANKERKVSSEKDKGSEEEERQLEGEGARQGVEEGKEKGGVSKEERDEGKESKESSQKGDPAETGGRGNGENTCKESMKKDEKISYKKTKEVEESTSKNTKKTDDESASKITTEDESDKETKKEDEEITCKETEKEVVESTCKETKEDETKETKNTDAEAEKKDETKTPLITNKGKAGRRVTRGKMKTPEVVGKVPITKFFSPASKEEVDKRRSMENKKVKICEPEEETQAEEKKVSEDTTDEMKVAGDKDSKDGNEKETNKPDMIRVSEDNESMNIDKDEKESEEDAKSSLTNTLIAVPETTQVIKKKLTPKQREKEEERKKKLEEREKKRQEKEKKKQEELAEKEKKKKEREEEKIKQKEEKEKIKEDQRKKRQEELESKRQLKEQKKEEEKQRKEEEKQRKEEEKQRKEEEKQKKEEEKQRKEEARKQAEEEKNRANEKLKNKFASYFVTKKRECKDEEAIEEGLFKQFRIKEDMRLAPLRRRMQLTPEQIVKLDACVAEPNTSSGTSYLEVLKGDEYVKGFSQRTFPPQDKSKNTDDDVEIIEEEEEDPEEAVISELVEGGVMQNSGGKLQPMGDRGRPKLLLFCENRRPAYWGTWGKRSEAVSARRPFAKDSIFDYEYDSDDDWEEEEAGESLSDSEGEDKDEADEDQYEVDNEFFVPHGYLSDDEAKSDQEEEMEQEKDDIVQGDGDRNMKLKQKQAEFDKEMKKKTRELKPRVIGCCFEADANNNPVYEQLLRVLIPYKAVPFCQLPISTKHCGGGGMAGAEENDADDESVDDKKAKYLKTFPEDAVPALIRLVHGNRNRKMFLSREFCDYLKEENKEKGDRFVSRAKTEAKIKELGRWRKCPERGPMHNVLMWYVPKDIREKYGVVDLSLPNSWTYINKPKVTDDLPAASAEDNLNKTPKTPKHPTIIAFAKKITPGSSVHSTATTPVSKSHTDPKSPKNLSIMAFTKKITPHSAKNAAATSSTPSSSPTTSTSTPKQDPKVDCSPDSGVSEISPNVSSSEQKTPTETTSSKPGAKRKSLVFSQKAGQDEGTTPPKTSIASFFKKPTSKLDALPKTTDTPSSGQAAENEIECMILD